MCQRGKIELKTFYHSQEANNVQRALFTKSHPIPSKVPGESAILAMILFPAAD